jgi:hypothetical protein
MIEEPPIPVNVPKLEIKDNADFDFDEQKVEMKIDEEIQKQREKLERVQKLETQLVKINDDTEISKKLKFSDQIKYFFSLFRRKN